MDAGLISDNTCGESVVEAVSLGDRTAFTRWMHENAAWVKGVIYGILGDGSKVDDVAQVVWTRVWQQIDSLEHSTRWKSWLYRLARNAALDARRSKKRYHRLQESFRIHNDGRPSEGEDPLLAVEQKATIRNAIHALPELYRVPFVLRHLENWNYRQIAETLDITVEAVETRLMRARRYLREGLKDKI